MENLILVNRKDEIVGYEDKEKCHQGKGILHRAFTIFVFNKESQVLIQQRSKFKKLWPLFWETSCSGHPKKDEGQIQAAKKRLKEELGIDCQLELVDKFQYQAPYRNIGAENEVCAILIGKYNGEIQADPKEVASWKWINLEDLRKDIFKNPQKYAPWLQIGLKRLLSLKKAGSFSELSQPDGFKSISELNSLLSRYSKLIEPTIEKILTSYVDEKFREIVKYQILTGGKRLRPALALITCQLLGGKIKDALAVAAGLEILHNYTLIVDDIIDNSNFRRGKPTTWFKFGNSIAQCIAPDYSAAVFQAAILTKKPLKIVELFAKTLKVIVDGEIFDILFEQETREEEPYIVKNRYQNISMKDYLKMVSKKTAILLQSSCEAGGIMALAKEKELIALRNYGFNLGIAFQIQDDILDIFGERGSSLKEIGKDIKERKRGNIVILFALEELPKNKKEKILKIMRQKTIKNKDIEEAIELINQTNAQKRAFLLGKKYIEKAKENLNLLPQNKWNNILRELADFVLARKK